MRIAVFVMVVLGFCTNYFEVKFVTFFTPSHTAVSPRVLAKYAAGKYATPSYVIACSVSGLPSSIYAGAPNVAVIDLAPAGRDGGATALAGSTGAPEVSTVMLVDACHTASMPSFRARNAAGRYATPLYVNACASKGTPSSI